MIRLHKTVVYMCVKIKQIGPNRARQLIGNACNRKVLGSNFYMLLHRLS